MNHQFLHIIIFIIITYIRKTKNILANTLTKHFLLTGLLFHGLTTRTIMDHKFIPAFKENIGTIGTGGDFRRNVSHGKLPRLLALNIYKLNVW